MTTTLTPQISGRPGELPDVTFQIPNIDEKIDRIRTISNRLALIVWLYKALATISLQTYKFRLRIGSTYYDIEKISVLNDVLKNELESNFGLCKTTRDRLIDNQAIPSTHCEVFEEESLSTIVINCSLPVAGTSNSKLLIDFQTSTNKSNILLIQRIYIPQLHYLLTIWLNQMLHLENTHEEKTPPSLLTRREVEVLQEFSLGKSIKEVSLSLNISINTVCTHCKNLYRKLGVNSRQKAMMAYQNTIR